MKYVKEDSDPRIVQIFESTQEFIAAVSKGADKNGASHEDYDWFEKGWAGTKTFKEAVELARTGWHEARPSVDAILNPLREKLADKLSVVTERFHDIQGYEPDIDRFVAGELECMYEDLFVEAPTNGKVYTLLISGAVNCTVSAETLKRRGTAIVALVEAFQMVGTDVEIWLETSFKPPRYDTKDEERSYTALTKIHAAGTNLDIDEIMMPLAHPAWFRRLCFAIAEAQSPAVREEFGFHQGRGYGRAADLRVMDIVEPTFTLTKGGESADTRKMDSDPLGFILDTLRAQGAFDDTDEWGS